MLIHPWALAVGQGLKMSAFARMIASYPTLGEIGKRAAGDYYAAKLFGAAPRRLARFLALFG